jgi:hypothetical protein
MDSYDSRYPISYYEIGEKYLFYKGRNHELYREATDEEIKKYYVAFNEDDNKISGQVLALKYNRLVGIVVDKDTARDKKYISVLFDNKTVWDYVVEYKPGVFFDEQERKLDNKRYDFGPLPSSAKALRSNGKAATATFNKSTSTGIAPDTEKKGGSTGIAPDTKDKKTAKASTGIAPDKKDINKKVTDNTVVDAETGELSTGIAPDKED